MLPISLRDEEVTIRYASDLLNEEQRQELEKAIWDHFMVETVHWQTSKPGSGQIHVVKLDADVDEKTLVKFLDWFLRERR